MTLCPLYMRNGEFIYLFIKKNVILNNSTITLWTFRYDMISFSFQENDYTFPRFSMWFSRFNFANSSPHEGRVHFGGGFWTVIINHVFRDGQKIMLLHPWRRIFFWMGFSLQHLRAKVLPSLTMLSIYHIWLDDIIYKYLQEKK